MEPYLDELDYCLTLPPAATKMVPVRDRQGWHLYFIQVPASWRWSAIVLG